MIAARAVPITIGALLASSSPFATPEALAQDTERLSLEHYMDMESVSNPQISPDASTIVYTRGWVDKVNDRRESSLWIMDSDGSRNRHLLDAGSARWSPDGTRILYTAAGEPTGSQIFVRWMDAEGAESQITRQEALILPAEKKIDEIRYGYGSG